MTEIVRIDGLKELDRKLSKLPKDVGFKTLRSALMQTSTKMFKMAKANAEATGIRGYDAGATAAAMGRWTRKMSETRTVLFMGPKNKNKKALALWNERHGRQVKRLNHFHLVEFGSVHGPAQPFLRPAIEASRGQIIRDFGKKLGMLIEKAAKKRA